MTRAATSDIPPKAGRARPGSRSAAGKPPDSDPPHGKRRRSDPAGRATADAAVARPDPLDQGSVLVGRLAEKAKSDALANGISWLACQLAARDDSMSPRGDTSRSAK